MKAVAFAVRAAVRREFADSTDADLLRRFAAAKDGDAFAELVRRYGPLVWRVARTTAAHVAEDVFQATFLTLSKTAASVRDPAALAGWLHRTAYRTAVRAQKAEAKRTLPRPPAEPGAAADPLDVLTARELLAAVDEELAALPDALRAAVVLCGVEGLSQDEAAARLGWTPGSVKGRLERGRAKLLARLAARGLALPAVLGGLAAVPAELVANTLECVRGAIIAPAVAALLIGGNGMTWFTVLKPASVLAAIGVALVVAASGGADPGPTAGPQVVNVKPATKEEPPSTGLIRWSSPLRTDLDDPSLPGGTTGVWTPDGKAVLIAGSARKGEERVGEVWVRDATNGKLLHTFRGTARGYENRAGHLAISPDGRTVAAGGQWYDRPDAGPGGRSYFVEVWDWGQEKPRLKLAGDPAVWPPKDTDRLIPPARPDHFPTPVNAVVFSADGKSVSAVDRTGLVKGWELNRGLRLFESQTGRTSWGLARSPDGRMLAVSEEGRVTFLSPVGKIVGRSSVVGSTLLSVTFSPDGRSVVVGGLTNDDRVPVAVADVRITEAGEVLYVAAAETANVRHGPANYTDLGAVYQVAYSPDGKLLAAACQDKSVRVFDAATLKPVAVAVEHKDFVYSVQFSPDGRSLLTVGRDATKVWSVAELMKRVPKDDPAAVKGAAEKRDRVRFIGEWHVRSTTIDGRELTDAERSKKDYVVYTADGIEQRSEGKVIAFGKVSALDATAVPKTIDYEIATGADKGKVVKAVYEFVDWGTYRVCYGAPGGERPKAIESKPGSGSTVHVLKRVLPKKD